MWAFLGGMVAGALLVVAGLVRMMHAVDYADPADMDD